MDRPTLTVGDIVRRYGDAYRHAAGRGLSTAQRRVMTAIAACRTAALGGHVEHCETIGTINGVFARVVDAIEQAAIRHDSPPV